MHPYDAPPGALAPRAPSPDLTIGARLIDRRNAAARMAGPTATLETTATALRAAPARSDPPTPPDETAAMLILLQTGAEDPSAYAALVEDEGSAHTVLLNERLRAAPQTSLFADPEQELDAELAQAKRELAGWRAQGMQTLTVLDPGYPDTLRAAPDRPPLLFVAGRLKPRDERAVAVVGAGVSTP